MMDGSMGGMMAGMWLWGLAGLLVVVLLVILIVKALRR
jgi:predicted PurR-regulated permease PerM